MIENYNLKRQINDEDWIAEGNDEEEAFLNLSYRIVSNNNLQGKQSKLSEELRIFKNTLNKQINSNAIIKLEDKKIIKIFIPLDNADIMQITLPVKLLVSPTTYIFVLWVIFLTITILIISLLLLRNQIGSILKLVRVADSFGKGLDSEAYQPSGAQEIRLAGIAFLKMRERINKQIAKRTQMLAMISHDLRTPLTRMKLQLELMNQNNEINELKQDVKAMEYITGAYLDFAKGEGGEEFEKVNIYNWLKDLINAQYKHDKILISIDTNEDAMVAIKPNAFNRAITNIINNAKDYATKIALSIYSLHYSNLIAIDIEDNGVGIKDKEKQKVFTPFYRGEKSNKSNNIGLGLAITKEIIAGHYGEIKLKNSNNLGGLLVQITLPKYKITK
ncbi:MAG: sensor histidine kinase [Rickettsiaceae bacterium]